MKSVRVRDGNSAASKNRGIASATAIFQKNVLLELKVRSSRGSANGNASGHVAEEIYAVPYRLKGQRIAEGNDAAKAARTRALGKRE
jgi:hypothetical protein